LYLVKLKKAYKSLRTKVFGITTTLLGFMAARPEDAKIVLSEFVAKEWVNAHWQAIVIVVGVIASSAFAHGTARKESSTPIEER
jgi:hypothetical protein